MGLFKDVHSRSLADPEGFWGEAAAGIDWIKPWDRVLDDSNPPFYRWFAGGELNTCYNAVDRHVAAGRGDQAAIIYDSPVTDTVETISYAELQERVARCAGALAERGVTKGDRVIIYMPMVPEAVIAMLACARGSARCIPWSSAALRPTSWRCASTMPKPKAILSASCGIEPGSGFVEYKPLLRRRDRPGGAQAGVHCLILQRPQWRGEHCSGRGDARLARAMVADAEPATACVPRQGDGSPPTSSTPRAPPDSPRASCVRQRRSRSWRSTGP